MEQLEFNGNKIIEIKNLPLIRTKCIISSLKLIISDYIISFNININLIIPKDIIDYINSFEKQCFICHKKKYIYMKKSLEHKKYKVPVTYLICWNCRNLFVY